MHLIENVHKLEEENKRQVSENITLKLMVDYKNLKIIDANGGISLINLVGKLRK